MRLSMATNFLAGGGEMGCLMRNLDLGGDAAWSDRTLSAKYKTSVQIMLTSRQPIWIGWGSELIYLYNDPYKSIIGVGARFP